MLLEVHEEQAAPIGDGPERLLRLTTNEKFSITEDALDDIQLAGVAGRFAALVDQVPVLARFAEEQKIARIERLEDAAPLLFPHSLYKSYSLSVIEKNRFDLLTRWLNSLTAHDLSSVDASACEGIDDWIALLDTTTDIRIKHSSGTSGKLSFIPRSVVETPSVAWGYRLQFDGFGDEPNAGLHDAHRLPIVLADYRKGAMATPRAVDAVVDYFADAGPVTALYDGRISADMLSLGGRVQAAQRRGETAMLSLPPALLARGAALVKSRSADTESVERFFAAIAGPLRRQRVVAYGAVVKWLPLAEQGQSRGIDHLFAADSLAVMGGGNKGGNLPDDYRETISRFVGMPFPLLGYGMTEMVASSARMCPHGHYHLAPHIVPYLLDPHSGDALPRDGTRTGRFGFVDLAAQTHWGGFLTGDEVTLSFTRDASCACGRKGAYLHADIRRYSESEGGDDKITCAGAPEMHDKALDFINQIAG